MPQLPAWESGAKKPTLRQLEHFANAVHVPVGFLFLPEPPVEVLPIPDFRTIGNEHIGKASPDLLDTIHGCQQRQAEVVEECNRYAGINRFPYLPVQPEWKHKVTAPAHIQHEVVFGR